MDQTLNIESTLFFDTAVQPEFETLAQWVVRIFARSHIRVSPIYSSETDLVFEIGALKLSIARSDSPLDLKKFIQSKEPGTVFGPARAVQRQLVEHEAAIVIRVSGPESAAQSKTKLAICYMTTLQAIALQAPGLVHWSKSNTLYTYDQFFRQTGDTPPLRRPAKPKLLVEAARPELQHMPVNCLSVAESEDHKLAMDALRTDTLRRFVFRGPRPKKVKSTGVAALFSGFSAFALSLLLNAQSVATQVLVAVKFG